MLDERIARVKTLIAKREEIDAELAQLLGIEPKKPRGRPAKQKELFDAKAEPAPQ
ncbi:MAG: hypothetical protein ACLQME_07920 [Alphaproteobacteria bacterium]